MGLLEVLTVIFVILKLVGVISWSWWIVLIPLYILLVIYAVLISIIVVGNIRLKREIDKEFGGLFKDD